MPRILIVSPIPLVPELGAAQMAMNLGAALMAQGSEVTLWRIPPQAGRPAWWLPPFGHWRTELERFVSREGPFDVIDAPAQALSRRLSRAAICVARGVQPELRYQWAALQCAPWGSAKQVAYFLRGCIVATFVAGSLWRGWSCSQIILCLGSLDKDWMLSRFPWWKEKIIYYVNALSEEDQKTLALIRQRRSAIRAQQGVRFLWIGRWVAHKGTHLLIDFVRQRLETCSRDTFTIAGCGAAPYRGFPTELQDHERVRVVSHYQRSDLPGMLAEHDVGLFTSLSEGWGLSLNEMIEAGMPIWTTDAGGVTDLRQVMGSHLPSFPPPSADLPLINTCALDWKRYYDTFSWNKIARLYLANLPNASISGSFGS